jgi:hypothetical protein
MSPYQRLANVVSQGRRCLLLLAGLLVWGTAHQSGSGFEYFDREMCIPHGLGDRPL